MTITTSRTLVAASVLSLLALPVAAAGYTDPAAAPVPASPVPMVMPVAAATDGDWSGAYLGGQLAYGNLDFEGTDTEGDGTLYGVQGGYQRDFGRFVLGAEASYSGAEIGGDDTAGPDLESFARVNVRAGYDAGRVLPYATVGYARAQFGGDFDDQAEGVVYGIGADYALSDRITVGAEVLQHDFDEIEGASANADADLVTFGVRANYRF